MICLKHYSGYISFISERNASSPKEDHRHATGRRQNLSHEFCCKVVLVKNIELKFCTLDVKQQSINLRWYQTLHVKFDLLV